MALETCEVGEINAIQAIMDENVANQVCNDEYNHNKCNFDGGDCCSTHIFASNAFGEVLILCNVHREVFTLV